MLDECRKGNLIIDIQTELEDPIEWGALVYFIGKKADKVIQANKIPLLGKSVPICQADADPLTERDDEKDYKQDCRGQKH